ncbi:hypothetical protein BGZ76_001054 [Entomortierella beljakovae]|nr:hypothetical protein BGZ76_001054 [Entomortierella beljakovae]
MVSTLINQLVTALDIIPDSSTVDICTSHPSTCVLTGKIRIISKKPITYKSLVLTFKGVSCITHFQGPKSMRDKDTFIEVSKNIVYEKPIRPRRDSLSPLSSPVQNTVEVLGGNEGHERNPSIDSNMYSTLTPVERTPSLTMSPVERTTSQSEPPATQLTLNQLSEGVNDIDFRIEFPSHVNPLSEESTTPSCLPPGPLKTGPGHSFIDYSLTATLLVSRKFILVNNQMSVTIPVKIQNWQDMIEWDQSEDCSYHGTRENKIEFQFQVPKQLDWQRLQDLQFGFSAKWRTLQDRLKIKEIQYYIIEEEQQRFSVRGSPVTNTTIISTSVTHDCSGYNLATNRWGQLRSAARLQIPQPNTVLESTTTPWPHRLTISHKLRVLIHFDNSLAHERQLQLSFPIRILSTLEEDGSPVHPGLHHVIGDHPRRHRRIGRSLYGEGEGEAEDDEEQPLPIYGDREESLLLMAGQEIHEAGIQVDALSTSMGVNILNQNILQTSSRMSISSYTSDPSSPTLSSGEGTFILENDFDEQQQQPQDQQQQQQQPTPLSSPSMRPVSNRASTIGQISSLLYPPPYILSTLDEEQDNTLSSNSPLSSENSQTSQVVMIA